MIKFRSWLWTGPTRALVRRARRKILGEEERDWHNGLLNTAVHYIGDDKVIERWINACGLTNVEWSCVIDPKPGDVYHDGTSLYGIVIDSHYILNNMGEMQRRDELKSGYYTCPLKGAWHRSAASALADDWRQDGVGNAARVASIHQRELGPSDTRRG